MENSIKTDMIMVIVNKGFSSEVMDVARAHGATGGTILSGKGTGGEKAQKFFAMSLQEEKEVVMILVKEEIRAETDVYLPSLADRTALRNFLEFSKKSDKTEQCFCKGLKARKARNQAPRFCRRAV